MIDWRYKLAAIHLRHKLASIIAVAILLIAFNIVFAYQAVNASPIAKESKPLPDYLSARMASLDLKIDSPIYIRVFKQENTLEVWKQSAEGTYKPLAFYTICKQSGKLGQKRQEGDYQVPEGFYSLTKEQLHPKSNYHLAFNVGYPNLRDRNNNYTGSLIMVHGKCLSVGCLAMGDDRIEEIYTLLREAFKGGAKSIPMHIFPFKMSDDNLAQFDDHPEMAFWQQLKPAYDLFQNEYIPARTVTCGKNYVVTSAENKNAARTVCAQVKNL